MNTDIQDMTRAEKVAYEAGFNDWAAKQEIMFWDDMVRMHGLDAAQEALKARQMAFPKK